MIELLDNLAAVFGYVVLALTGVSGVVWCTCRTFSERWLKAQFAKQPEAYKHEQQKDLLQLKFAVDAHVVRTAKLHQLEF